MSPPPADLGDAVKRSWHRFLEDFEPLRPELYRYCRYLTGSPWDAEDMAQDALARAFVTLACLREPPANPRAWLFRVASNGWLNHVRHVRDRPAAAEDARGHEPPGAAASPDPRAAREAAGTLFAQLAPQERAALVLKQVFDLSLEEIAEALSTSPGAIKAALHRGRGKLSEPVDEPRSAVAPPVLDAFCAAFNARDLERLTALLLDTSIVELPGLVVEVGPAAARAGTFRGTLLGCAEAGHEAPLEARSELRIHRGEALLLWWAGGEVQTVVRAVVEDGRIARLTSYYHAPEVVEEVCRELGVPFRTHGYHYWNQGEQP